MRLSSSSLRVLMHNLVKVDPCVQDALKERRLQSYPPRSHHPFGQYEFITFLEQEICQAANTDVPGAARYIELQGEVAWRIRWAADHRNLCEDTDDDCSFLYEATNEWNHDFEYFWTR